MQRGQSTLGRRTDTGAVLEQQLHHLDAVLLAGDVQGREPVQRTSIGIGVSVQQQLRHPDVATVSGYVEGGQVIHGDLVHGSPMVEQDPGRVHVLSLSCHVQGCQTVLGLGTDWGSAFQQHVHHLFMA